MTALPGRFNDGRTAASRPVLVTPKPTGLDIRGTDGLLVAFWQSAHLRDDGTAPGGTGLRLSCTNDPGARLLVEQPQTIRPLLPAKPGLPWGKALAMGAATLALGAGLWLGIPAGARLLAAAIPPALEQRWGAQLAEGLERHWGGCHRPGGEAALHLLSDRLAAGLAPQQRPRKVAVVNIKDENAIALPGGNVLVFRGLLDKAADPDELAGVLGHEFTHVALRHPIAGMIRALGIGLVATIITGDASGAVGTGTALALANSYTRDDEAAADRGAVTLLNSAGLGTNGLARFFRRVGETSSALPQWLNTHPDSQARAKAVEQPDTADEPALNAEQWMALKGICR